MVYPLLWELWQSLLLSRLAPSEGHVRAPGLLLAEVAETFRLVLSCCGEAGLRELFPSLDSCSCKRLATLGIQVCGWQRWLKPSGWCCFAAARAGSGGCFLRWIAVLVYNSEGHVRPPGLWLATLAGRCCFAVARPWSGSGFLRSTALVSFCLISFRRPR